MKGEPRLQNIWILGPENVEMNLATSDSSTVKMVVTRVFEHNFHSSTYVTAAMRYCYGESFPIYPNGDAAGRQKNQTL